MAAAEGGTGDDEVKRLTPLGRDWADAAAADMRSRGRAKLPPPLSLPPAGWGGRSRATILRTCYLMQFCWLSSMLLGMEAKMAVYLRHWNGDTARYISTNSFGQSVMNLSSLFLTPLFAALAESRGRRFLLALGTRFAAAMRILECIVPIPRILTATQCLNGITMASQTGAFISVTDLFPGDAKGAAGAMALLQMSNMAAVTFSPMLGTALAARSETAVFVLSACLAALNALLAATVPETQAPGQRLALSARGLAVLNPFAFTQLFRRGRRLALLSLTEILFMMTEPRNTSRGAMLVNGASLGAPCGPPSLAGHDCQDGDHPPVTMRGSCGCVLSQAGVCRRRVSSRRWKACATYRATSSPRPPCASSAPAAPTWPAAAPTVWCGSWPARGWRPAAPGSMRCCRSSSAMG